MKIEQGAVVALSTEPDVLHARIDELASASSFMGAVVLRALDDHDRTATLVRWSDRVGARAAMGEPIVDPRTAPLIAKALQVRGSEAPINPEGDIEVESDGTRVLLVRVDVEPERCEALLGEMNSATDDFLPRFDAVYEIAFHCTDDRRYVFEYLRCRSALSMAMIQADSRMREHMKRVEGIATQVEAGLFKIDAAISTPEHPYEQSGRARPSVPKTKLM